MTMKTAWVFPGQGSQAVGMGVDLATTPIGKDRFQQAENILGWSVLDKCQGGGNGVIYDFVHPTLSLCG